MNEKHSLDHLRIDRRAVTVGQAASQDIAHPPATGPRRLPKGGDATLTNDRFWRKADIGLTRAEWPLWGKADIPGKLPVDTQPRRLQVDQVR
jgi:hypothetical protein